MHGLQSELAVQELAAFWLGFARVLPLALLLPALGLSFWPRPVRWGFAVLLALTVTPTSESLAIRSLSEALVGPRPSFFSSVELGTALVQNFLSGLPIAVGAVALLWAVGMSSSVFASTLTGSELSDDRRRALELLITLPVWIAFLEMGGPARVALALSRAPVSAHTWTGVARLAATELLGAIEVAVGFALPALTVMVLVSLLSALLEGVGSLRVESLAPLRPVVALVLVGLLLTRLLGDVAGELDARLGVP